jgi:hypothetical protein
MWCQIFAHSYQRQTEEDIQNMYIENLYNGRLCLFYYKDGKQEKGTVIAETPHTYTVQYAPLVSGTVYKAQLKSIKSFDGRLNLPALA